MDNPTLDKSLRTLLHAPQARAAERIGIATLADFARVIEQFGLVRPHTTDGCFHFADFDDAPSLRNFGKLSWATVLAELTAAGFDWRQHIVNGYQGKAILGETNTALRLSIKRRIDELMELLREYQRRNPEL